jgi:ssDNA-binding Zn-finger/Zn-ribbon topoisomerase 1
MSDQNSRSLSMDPYLPWYHQADVKRFAGDERAPITLTDEEFAQKFGSTKTAIAPLLAVGGRLLLSQALGGLMRKAINGAGNFLDTAPQDPYAQAGRPVGLVASEHTAVGVGAPVETPHSTPDLVEDHDPESVDQQEFNDGDNSPAFNNPNNDNADGGLSQSQGEDDMHQKLEFRHDGDGVSQAELLLPLILEFINSEKSGLEHPQLKALHEALEAEIPGYLDHADENDEVVQKFLDELRKPDGVHASTREGYSGEALMPANNNPQADFIQQALRMVEYLESIGDFAGAEKYRAMAEQAGHTVGPTTAPQHQLVNQGVTGSVKEAAPVYMTTPMAPGQQQMGVGQQQVMPGTHANPVQPGGMPVSGKCMNCGGVVNADGSCPQCGAAAGANQMGNMETGQQQTPLGIMPSPYAHTSADHQGPITPQQKQVFAEYLIAQGRQDEVAPMMANPGIYAEEWSQYLNRQTQPPEVDPTDQQPMPEVPPQAMGQMPMPGMSVPPPGPMASTRTADSDRRCPKCTTATTTIMNDDGGMRCHRCGHVWNMDVVVDSPTVKSHWVVKSLVDPIQPNQSPANPVGVSPAELTEPGDPSQQQDSTLTWQDASGTPLQVGQTYEMHSTQSAIPDMVKVEAVKPDSITVTMVGEYNAPSDPQDANGPGYTHEIDRSELDTAGLTFNPVQGEGEQEQSQDQADQDGVGQTVNTEPVEQPHDQFPVHAKTENLPTDYCPKCDYGHVTSSYLSPEVVQYECFRCANQWTVEDPDEGSALATESREWLHEDSSDFNFDRVVAFEAAQGKGGRDIRAIAEKDPVYQAKKERLNANKAARTAGAKFSPREQKEFIDEDGVARNADLLNLDGTHYESAFDLSKANPDKVNDNYIGLGL